MQGDSLQATSQDTMYNKYSFNKIYILYSFYKCTCSWFQIWGGEVVLREVSLHKRQKSKHPTLLA